FNPSGMNTRATISSSQVLPLTRSSIAPANRLPIGVCELRPGLRTDRQREQRDKRGCCHQALTEHGFLPHDMSVPSGRPAATMTRDKPKDYDQVGRLSRC